jgi:hypothetical protein
VKRRKELLKIPAIPEPMKTAMELGYYTIRPKT